MMKISHLIVILFLFSSGTVLGQGNSSYQDLSYPEIDSLELLYDQQQDLSAGNDLLQFAVGKATEEFGEQDSIVANYKQLLALNYYMQGQNDKALVLWLAAKRIYKETVGEGSPTYSNVLGKLGILYFLKGEYNVAAAHWLEAKDVNGKYYGKDHPEYAKSVNNLAILYTELEEYSKALLMYQEAKDIVLNKFGKSHPFYSSIVNNMAIIYDKIGEYDKALGAYEESMALLEQQAQVQTPLYAHLLNNIATVYIKKKQYAQAIDMHNRAKELRAKLFGKRHPDYSSSLQNTAEAYIELKEYDKAIALLIESQMIVKQLFGEKHPTYSVLSNDLASCYFGQGDYQQAWSTIDSVFFHVNAKKVDSKNITDTDVAELVATLDSIHIPLKTLLQSYELAYELLQTDTSVSNPNKKQQLYTNLASQSLVSFRRTRTNEKDKLTLLGESSIWLKRGLVVMSPEKHFNTAFGLAEQNKSALLLQATKSEVNYRLGALPDSLIRQDKALLQERDQLQAQLQEKRSKEELQQIRGRLNEVSFAIEEFSKKVAADFPKYYKLKYENKEVNIGQIQEQLQDSDLLIEYVITDSILHIFSVSHKAVNWYQQYLPEKVLVQKVKELHGVLSNYSLLATDAKATYRSYTQLAHWFYQQLLGPVLKDQNTTQNLIVVTDGELGHLPFEVFLVEAAPQKKTDYGTLHYLLKDYSVSYNYSAALWQENREATKQTNNQKILGLASNYEYIAPNDLTNLRLDTEREMRTTLNPLPQARKEVEVLQEKFEGDFWFDNQASEKNIKEHVADYAVVHLAMHGLLNADRPVLSSLAMTEDGDSLENNFWQAHEISKMELNADLVVLSACETGYGRFEQGNGIASLARSFMYAGASSLIVSLWQVNDDATAVIMQKMYTNLADDIPKDEALRRAKLEYLSLAKGIASHPAFWSPFIQIGNTNPISISQKSNWKTWGVTLIVLLLTGLVGQRWYTKKYNDEA